jgi:hypothetical protein
MGVWSNGYPLALLNTSILTADGVFELTTVSGGDACDVAWHYWNAGPGHVESYIGHDATAQLISAALGFQVVVNRVAFEQQVGQEALVFKLNGRAAEGRILTLADLYEIGFTWKHLLRTA